MVKVGYPSQQNSPSCEYARLDFEHDEEFASFFSKYRAEIADTIRQLTMVTQKFTFSFVSQWLRTIIAKPVDTGEDPSAANCNLSSPSFLEWDSLTMFVEGVMSRLSLDDENQVHEGVDLLNLVLAFETQDPLILSCSLSCLSSLFIFLKYTPGVLPTVLKKIFAAVIFNLPGQTKSTRSKAVKNVRQHACSVLVKICKDYQTLMFPVFKDLCGCMQAIIQDQDQLSQMEECILTEALILVSNQHEDFAKQSAFLAEKLKPVQRFWSSEEFRQAFMYPDKLMHFIGLDQAPVEPSSEDTCGINRSHISYCTHMILAVIKRSTWPKDSEKASMGGFVFHKLESGEYVMKNPATRQIHGLLGNVLYLLKSMNMLFCEENLKLRHPEFAKAYDVLDNDIQSLMGIQPPCVDNTGNALCKHPLQRMQHFLTEGYDIW
ncbi:hypothetical protein DPMN_088177 [Dreissena polymorpha]|uniref:Exportin-5 C-terminal domain-containing protein n=1 Tax=Dreissena polymorpha TaxID=45954 RepID=A0A9D4KTN3_DREPO|nr:hypothetical protein DPMN_088177 [Dreissena polymorpha]